MPASILNRLRKTASVLTLAVALMSVSACDTAEERAEKHFQSGMELLEAGDVDRALVEFRNVFKLNGQHREARQVYAKAERDRGRLREAYSQYLRLVEQYPDDLDGQRALAEIAAQTGDWAEAEVHVTTALALKPDDLPSQAVKLALDYGRAKTDSDLALMDTIATQATELRGKLPDSQLLLSVLIDHALASQNYPSAMSLIDTALTKAPDDRVLYGLRLSTLAAQGDDAAVEAGLIEMLARFPDDASIKETLIRWYVSRREVEKGEAFLRGQVDPADESPVAVLDVVRFVAENRGIDAAIAEIDAHMAASTTGAASPVLRSTRAGLMFDAGKRDEAIAEMEAVLKVAPPSEDTQKIKVGLARMLISNGNAVGARALVEEVLAEDPGDLPALKLKASWLILNDAASEAITILRGALDDTPNDAETLTLLAQAHERDGNRGLMRDMLSLAVEASGRAPGESLRYAQALASDGEYLTAETVLIEALRLSPASPGLLVPLGQIYVQIKDWPRAEAVAAQIESLNEPALADTVAGLRASIFEGQQRTDQAIGYLQGLVDEGEAGLGAKVAIIRAHLANGQNAEALAYAEKLLVETPDDPSLRFIRASIQSVTGDNEPAEATYRELLKEDPTRTQVWMSLYRVVGSDPGRQDEAGAIIEEALAVLPDVGELRWAKAGYLERKGDIDGAIAVYEDLYAENSSNMIIANNLASLISSYRTDDESLARAEVIARRLRGSSVAAYQDTYGWIAYRRGNLIEAEAELGKAAAGLPDDPMVQYHLAMTYLAVGRKADALTQFNIAIALVKPDDTRDFVASAKAEIAKLQAEGITANN